MKLTKKSLEAVDLIAQGKSRLEAATELGVAEKQVAAWLRNSDFVDLVEQRHSEYGRETRWMLMRYRAAALNIIHNGMSGNRVTTAEEKMAQAVLRTLGAIVTEPPKPLPVGEVKVQLGTRRQDAKPIEPENPEPSNG